MTTRLTTEALASPRRALGQRDAGTLAALADALRSESRLMADLVQVMRRQREAVASDDPEGIDGAIFDTHRVLLTLAEVRRRRRSLNRILGEPDDLSLAALEQVLHGNPPVDVRGATEQLRDAALVLQREVDTNRRILRSAGANSPTGEGA